MPRHRQLAQIIVIVSIERKGKKLKALYTYTNPHKNEFHYRKQECHIAAQAPYHTVYALDYKATLAGWHFRKRVEAKSGSRSIPYHRASNRLRMTTKYEAIDTYYSFYLLFKNRKTGECWYDDPQEANVPPPQED